MYEYIAYNLLVPETATIQIQRILKSIWGLDEMPMRYELYDYEPWHSRGLRFLSVDNYIVFYLPKEETNVINVVRILYGKRDLNKQLNS
ncbi:MAG: type II toxin-antitoxin system RelE/ParE family toxin [Clostridiales bacterium]|nr:type II toxin-antitoxin system RelE/ParE family toxin [Clostridiales bacterium]